MRFYEEAQQNIHQHVYEIIRQHIKGCTTCVSYTHEKNCYETTKSSTGRKNLMTYDKRKNTNHKQA